jgi:hypothetical protein
VCTALTTTLILDTEFSYELGDTGEPAPEPVAIPPSVPASRSALTDSDDYYDYRVMAPPRPVAPPVISEYAHCSLVQRKEELVTGYAYYGTSTRTLRKRVFGNPMVLTVKNPVTYQELYDACLHKLARFIDPSGSASTAQPKTRPANPPPRPPRNVAASVSYRSSRQGLGSATVSDSDGPDRGYNVIGSSSDDNVPWTGDVSPEQSLGSSADNGARVTFIDDATITDDYAAFEMQDISTKTHQQATAEADDQSSDERKGDDNQQQDDQQQVNADGSGEDEDDEDDEDNDRDDDDDEEEGDAGDEEQEDVPWFDLRLVDLYGMNDHRILRPDDPPFNLYDRQTIAICWNSDALEDFYDARAERVCRS